MRAVRVNANDGAHSAVCDGERGSTLLITLFYSGLCLVVILLVTATSSLYLERKRLFALADAAATVGAEAFELEDVVMTADGARVILKDSDVEASVIVYLAENPVPSLHELRIDDASTPDGSSAQVSLSAYWRPPLAGLLLPEGIRLDVTSVARSIFS
jgi:hypothetical protein